MSQQLGNFACTCGFKSPRESLAIQHAVRWHLSADDRTSIERLKARVRVMIYSVFGLGFSFDRKDGEVSLLKYLRKDQENHG
jgi:hypothetical protein